MAGQAGPGTSGLQIDQEFGLGGSRFGGLAVRISQLKCNCQDAIKGTCNPRKRGPPWATSLSISNDRRQYTQRYLVIPANVGIQRLKCAECPLDPRFRGGDG